MSSVYNHFGYETDSFAAKNNKYRYYVNNNVNKNVDQSDPAVKILGPPLLPICQKRTNQQILYTDNSKVYYWKEK